MLLPLIYFVTVMFPTFLAPTMVNVLLMAFPNWNGMIV
jgi:hypothetical protein